MPELPEVETVARGLNNKVRGSRILDVRTDWPRHFSRSPGGFEAFREAVRGRKIEKVSRRAKQIVFCLSGGMYFTAHLKMTGAFLLGEIAESDKKHIHVNFALSGKRKMDFFDIRKFGRFALRSREELDAFPPDPFQITLGDLIAALGRRKGRIKDFLLKQEDISGIGNIYADEILHVSGIHPIRKASAISHEEAGLLFRNARSILRKAIGLRGTSIVNFRDTEGRRGMFKDFCRVYGREGEKCRGNCGGRVLRQRIGSRSAHFCGYCQK